MDFLQHGFTPKNDEEKWQIIKNIRNKMLSSSDWTQMPDAALTLTEKSAWQNYRQALRDMPQDFANPDDAIFPEQP